MKVKPYLWNVSQLKIPQAQTPSLIGPEKYCESIINIPPAPHHLQWINKIISRKSNKYLNLIAGNNLRISAPRGSAKTTVISTLLSWIIAHNPNIRIILCSYSEEVALNISVAVKQTITSDKYRNLYPHIAPSKRWRDKQWTVKRTNNSFSKDPTFFAVGASGAIASRRADLIILDDPIKSSKDIQNPSVRRAMNRWWSEVLAPTLVPEGRAIVLCTRYRIDDIHGTLFTEERGWDVINQSAIIRNPNGTEESYWEEYMTIKYLKALREKDPVAFASQYQNNPVSDDIQIIKTSWIVKGKITSTFDEVAIGIDLASSLNEQAHETAIVISGRKNDYYYLINYDSGRFTLHQTIQKLLKIYNDFPHVRLSYQIESVAYQIAFINEFKRVSLEHGVRAKIEEVKTRGDKTTRLIGISGLFESKKIIFNEAISTGKLIDQILNFGYSEFDDIVDALVYSINKLYKRRKKLEGSPY